MSDAAIGRSRIAFIAQMKHVLAWCNQVENQAVLEPAFLCTAQKIRLTSRFNPVTLVMLQCTIPIQSRLQQLSSTLLNGANHVFDS
jgi:hypothetical protein